MLLLASASHNLEGQSSRQAYYKNNVLDILIASNRDSNLLHKVIQLGKLYGVWRRRIFRRSLPCHLD